MAVYPDKFTIQETFLDGIPAEMCRALMHDDNLSPEVNTVTKFLVLFTGQKPVQGPTGDAPVTKDNRYAPRAGQPVQKEVQDGLPQDTSQVLQQHNAKDCKALKAQVQAAHIAAASSNAESNVEEEQEELINDEEVLPEVEEPEAEDDAESVHIDGDKYVTVDVYDN
ncbi:hypothetical protein C0995_015947, partial [Termitomyces sp. Mi166